MLRASDHWDRIYDAKRPSELSWFQEHAGLSLKLICEANIPKQSAIIDVGGGASILVDELLDRNYKNITVLDISKSALAAARRRLGHRAANVHWLQADILKLKLPENAYDLWHDRAVFHFLTAPGERDLYVRAVLRAVKPGGLVIVATFAEDGPEMCSGLPVMRYTAKQLHSEFGNAFEMISHQREFHHTPAGKVQPFVYCLCRKSFN